MSASLKYLTITQLFWDTLEQHRGHSRYAEIRAKIAWCVERKLHNRGHQTNGDAPFVSNKYLVGIWHCKLSSNPDVVMFYTLDNDTMNLAMIGTHHDYPHQGKHLGKAAPLAKKIGSSIDRGHVPNPKWKSIKWDGPQDIVSNYELDETTLDELEMIMNVLEYELYDSPLYKKVYGRDLLDEDEKTIEDWLAITDQALEAVRRAQTRVRTQVRDADRMQITEFTSKPSKVG